MSDIPKKKREPESDPPPQMNVGVMGIAINGGIGVMGTSDNPVIGIAYSGNLPPPTDAADEDQESSDEGDG